MKANLKDINLKYEELAEENIANNGDFSFLKDIVSLKKTKEKLIEEEKKLLKNEVKCFLQVKIPHFCKYFSPGTGGEFFR